MYDNVSIRDEKSEKCPRFSKKRIIYRECLFYIFNYLFLFDLAVYVLRHWNFVKCPCLSFFRFFWWGGGYYRDFFTKNIVFFIVNADFTHLAIYYNLIM